MKRVFKFFLPALTAMLVTLAGCMSEVTQAEYTEGKQYSVISPPVATQAPAGQVEVAEIFWYGCPHCFHLEPTINAYLKQKPANVYFNRIPGTLSKMWDFHGKMYYVGLLLDRDGSKGLHEKIFNAFHVQRRPIAAIKDDDSMRKFFESLGYKTEEINAALASMELTTKMNFARDVNAKSGIDSVPSIIVNGKYLTGPSRMSGTDNLVDVINYLSKLP